MSFCSHDLSRNLCFKIKRWCFQTMEMDFSGIIPILLMIIPVIMPVSWSTGQMYELQYWTVFVFSFGWSARLVKYFWFPSASLLRLLTWTFLAPYLVAELRTYKVKTKCAAFTLLCILNCIHIFGTFVRWQHVW